ncbi:unnamed protein product [Alopecurus aequalis]
MTSQPQPGPSTLGTAPRASTPASVEGRPYRATLQKCVALMDWWLERGKDGKIRVAGYTETKRERSRAARVFHSDSITTRHADYSLETADHKILLTRGPLNFSQMRVNEFPDEVSKYFGLGFPVLWEKYANLSISDIKQMNETTQSPLKSTEYYIEKFLRGSFINSEEYNFKEVDSKSSKGPTGNTDGPPSHRLSDLSNGTPRIQEPSCNSGDNDNSVSKTNPSGGLCNGRMDMPHESFEDPGPGKTCSGQTSQAAKPCELEVLAKELGPAFGGRTLRSGKVCGMSNDASFKKDHSKRKTVQQETLNLKGGSAAQTTAADKLQSKDSGDKGKGRGRPRKRART